MEIEKPSDILSAIQPTLALAGIGCNLGFVGNSAPSFKPSFMWIEPGRSSIAGEKTKTGSAGEMIWEFDIHIYGTSLDHISALQNVLINALNDNVDGGYAVNEFRPVEGSGTTSAPGVIYVVTISVPIQVPKITNYAKFPIHKFVVDIDLPAAQITIPNEEEI